MIIVGSNILLNNRGELKLADFGLARTYSNYRILQYTNRVITLWYRPPELLLGSTIYGTEVDIWGVACIMLEFFTKRAVFQGNDEISQLEAIYKTLGTPDNTDLWKQMQLPWCHLVQFKEYHPNRFQDRFGKLLTPAAMDLVRKMLYYEPHERISAEDALRSPYFTQEQPPACHKSELPYPEGDWHEYDSKQRKKKKPSVQSAVESEATQIAHTSRRSSASEQLQQKSKRIKQTTSTGESFR